MDIGKTLILGLIFAILGSGVGAALGRYYLAGAITGAFIGILVSIASEPVDRDS